MELRRSINSDITLEHLKQTIILNAKTLMQKDADFAKFAARILLSYIYEEVLGWDIVRDGIEAPRLPPPRLPPQPRPWRRDRPLNPRLLQFDLDKLADALDPAADLDFDFLGIQTLYDRYLIVDKKIKPSKRLETPQLFWMRVAMGLCVGDAMAIPRTRSSPSTSSTKAAASAPPRPRSSTAARCTPSSPPATSTRWTTASSPS
jgi:ribonucleoside-diphosphate reductase alpha chain